MSCVNLLCECMYLSTIVRFVTAKKIGFSRMIVSPAASIIQLCLGKERVMMMEIC